MYYPLSYFRMLKTQVRPRLPSSLPRKFNVLQFTISEKGKFFGCFYVVFNNGIFNDRPELR